MQHVKRQLTPEASQVDELYRQHAHTILLYVRKQVGSLEDAEDIVLEVFTAALESQTLAGLKDQEQQAWLHRVAANKCIDHYRRTTRKPTVPLEPLIANIYDEDEQAPDNIALRQEEYILLHKHLTGLTEQQREVLRLKFNHDLRSPEIAKLLNKSESAVRMMLARTLNALRDIYTRNGERRER